MKDLTKTEIKIILYKEKPIAKLQHQNDIRQYEERPTVCYTATSSVGLHEFRVFKDEMGETPFESKLPAQLLIRWLV